MEFNGAVLVCNKKIKNACENYNQIEEDCYSILNPLIKGLKEEYRNLCWLKRLLHDNSLFGLWDYQYALRVCHKAKVECKWDRVEENLLSGGLITKETYREFGKYFNNYDYTNDLSEMIKCGEPVYLNPQQASFVNKFYKEQA